MRKQRRQSRKPRIRPAKGKPSAAPEQLRVLIASASPLSAEGLAAMLRSAPEFDVLPPVTLVNLRQRAEDSAADVLIFDASLSNGGLGSRLHGTAELVPTIVILDQPNTAFASRALVARARAVLTLGFRGEELAAAVHAVHAGLLVVSADLSEALSLADPELSPDDQLPDLEIEALTPREREVLALIAEGLLNKEIADRLKLSEHTVKFHVSAIMAKLGAGSRTEAAMAGIRRGLVIV
ncbi:MAG TPA: response regulator transcription factor [Terriglobales bacterium]|nr:response regulator transcription factor [Terriglobales bacterium]